MNIFFVDCLLEGRVVRVEECGRVLLEGIWERDGEESLGRRKVGG